jgi:UDP-GlcNAc:undecaprenyl-phosphate GlcNAc-1-phosphate transferase
MFSLVRYTAYMFQAILAAVLLTLATGWVGIKIATRFGLIDVPGAGIALALTALILIAISGIWKTSEVSKLLLAALIIFIFGIWDDKRSLAPQYKFAGQALATVVLIALGIRIRIFEYSGFKIIDLDYLYVILDWLITILWVVGVTNAFNLVDSMDGLAVGLGAWAFAFFMLATFDSQQIYLSVVSSALLGICIGLFFYNAPPARLFLGDAGAQTLGFLLSTISILYTPVQSFQASSWFVPILLVGIPIFDTSLVFISRLRRKIPFYKGSCDHTYHRLVASGFDPGRAVFTMHLAALILECVAFVALSQSPFIANGMFLACLGLGVVGIIVLDKRSKWI